MSALNKLNYIFDKHQKWIIFRIVILIIIGTALELVGITAILPFVEVAMKPNRIFEDSRLNYVYNVLNLNSAIEFLILMGILLIVVYVVKNIFLIYMNDKIFRFTYNSQRSLANRLLLAYLKEPYTFFLNHNSADMVRNIKEDTDRMFDVIVSGMQLIAEIMVTLVLFGYLLYKDKTITIIVGITLVLFVFIVMRRIKSDIERFGERTRQAKAGSTKWLLQTFGGIKETMILDKKEYFADMVDEQYEIFATNQRKYQVMSYVPKPLMESVCICTVLFAIIVKLLYGVSPEYFVSTIAVFAVAAFRLLPAFNRITGYINRMVFGLPSLNAVCDDLVDIERFEKDEVITSDKEMPFEEKIEIRDLCYSYPNVDALVLNSLNMIIPKNKSVAFIGTSGAGKTTLADVILGLLVPNKGSVIVDGVDIRDNMHSWQKKLGYIPQTIFLMDDTIRNNIAYGIRKEDIDEDRLNRAIEDAQLGEFIASLDEGLDTEVGERGVRLSGGQRQRIGIARALYGDPEVLILDEATSALDNDTEAAIMEAVENLSGKKTMIIIAHRLSTIKNCDYVYEITADGVVDRSQDKFS
ncbi:MAG: ABC transporter ATP-binding protein/permease [Lachnospiraceae bacterium]|nr:ABC transporter ATP-binding protein/permease [Lachnospiraceae bacterium]